jgi:hypothetical protein
MLIFGRSKSEPSASRYRRHQFLGDAGDDPSPENRTHRN